MSHNPYIPDELQNERPSAFGMFSGLVISLAAQAALVVFLSFKFDVDWDKQHYAVAIVACWLLSYLVGWATSGSLVSERDLDPDNVARRYNVLPTRDDSARAAAAGTGGALIQFFCGSIYECVQFFLGRR